jgi:hypothetical protein
MAEIVCSHCGAVFFGATDVPVCPHCSQNPKGTPWKKVARAVSENLGFVLWFAWVFLDLRRAKLAWDDYVFLAVLLICAMAYPAYLEKTRRSGRGSVVTLDLIARAKSAGAAVENSWSPPPRPAVPLEWAPLVALTRPREVYWPFGSKMWTALEVAFIVGTAGYVIFRIHGSTVAFQHWARAWANNLPLLGITILADWFVFLEIYREMQNLQLLRDGEVTIGTIVDFISGRHRRATAVYQFWTRGGERFEHRASAMTAKEEFAGLVPVFYLPEDTSRSLALNCTHLRVRIPGDELATRTQRIGIKS